MKKIWWACVVIYGIFAVAFLPGCGSSKMENDAVISVPGKNEVHSMQIEKDIIEQNMNDRDAFIYKSIKDKEVQTLSKDDYEMKKEAEIKVNPLIDCVNSKGEMDHKIFSFKKNNVDYLLVLCHGYSDKKEYGIFMHGQYRTDYIQATEESLAYWARLGKLKNTKFDAVILSTCYSGYAPQKANMPIFDINLFMANNNKDVNFYWVETKNTGETILHLWRGIPKKSQNSKIQRDINSEYLVSPMIDKTVTFDESYTISNEEMKNIQML